MGNEYIRAVNVEHAAWLTDEDWTRRIRLTDEEFIFALKYTMAFEVAVSGYVFS